MVEGASWLREKRLMAGIRTETELAQRMSTSVTTVSDWEREKTKPQWAYVEPLATALGTTPSDVFASLWKEQLGDPCDCGCGGLKIAPANPRSFTLRVRLPCQGCGQVRSFEKSGRHAPLCRSCSHVGPRTTFTCDGYDDHGARRHAPRCPRQIQLRPGDIRNRHSQSKRYHQSRHAQYVVPNWDRPFLDEMTGRYRSLACASASVRIAQTEARLGKFSGERIRSRSQRREVLSTMMSTIMTEKRQQQMTQAARDTILASGGWGEQVRRAIAAGQLARAWSQRPLPAWTSVGRCIFCRRLTLQGRPTDRGLYHRPCFYTWSSTPEGRHFQSRVSRGLTADLPRPHPTRGRPESAATLKRHFAWAIQHHLGGESFRQIARKENIGDRAVREGVERILALLPEPERLATRFRRTVQLLRADATI